MAHQTGAYSVRGLQQFQDSYFQQQHEYHPGVEATFLQPTLQQMNHTQAPTYVDYDHTIYQGTTFHNSHIHWQHEPNQHFFQTAFHNSNQFQTRSQGRPQDRIGDRQTQRYQQGNQAQRGGRPRGRGQQNRAQNRQRYQEFQQRFQHDQLNPSLPVETLKPQMEDHRVDQDITYHDALTTEDNAANNIKINGGGRGGASGRYKRGGGRGNSQRNYPNQHFESRQNLNTPTEHYGKDTRDNQMRSRARGGRGRADYHRNYYSQQSFSEGSNKKMHTLNHKKDNSEPEKKSAPGDDSSSQRGQKQIKFRDFPLGAKNENTLGKGHSKGKLRNTKSVILQEGDIETQRGVLIEQLTSAEYECMVCCDSVRQEAAVWSCSNCHHVFHLRCVKRWARSPAASVEGDKSGGWRCPACQNLSQVFPHHYTCFCGKVHDPEWNRFDTPHSCGEVCGNQRSADCVHPCTVLCHPGPCPPCHASVTRACDCGKTKQTVKCGQPAPKCVQVCQKQLNCGKHECSAVCHPGLCQPCDISINQICYCGKEKRDVVCGTAESFTRLFSCKAICGRMLDCGNHTCQRECHAGQCDQCQLSPDAVTHCACGKSSLSELGKDGTRSSCLDPVPTCENICDKILKCGPQDNPHCCIRPCHQGDCGPCEDGVTSVVCRCAILEKKFPCWEAISFTSKEPFLCDKRCNRKRQCGRHRCPNVCCIDEDHPCTLTCGGKLSCGLHRCEEPCHRGNCPTCWQVSFEELHCHCGAEVLYPPIPCGTKPPPCNKTCRREHSCDHPVRHPCHSEVSCPPCTELTERWCMGRHELRRNIACHLVDISCGLPCGRPLKCGNHTCQLICHKGDCESEDAVCQQPCTKPRPECSHPCGAPCHEESPCPRGPCQAQIVIKCKCGNRSERALCQLGGGPDTQEYQKMATMMMAMKMADVQSGQSIDISSLMSSEGSKKKARQLECVKECAILERNKRLALALEIKNPDIQGKLGNPSYSLFLRDFTKQNMTFVNGVEKQLSELVLSAQKSKQPRRSHAFPPMNSAQRRVIHELAEAYGCQSQSYDVEPKKNVVVTAQKDRCWQPSVTLVTVVTREIYPKGPAPIPHISTDVEVPSGWGTSEFKSSKSTKVKMAPWGKSAIAAKPAPELPEPTQSNTVMSWASQFKRTTPPTVEPEKNKDAEIDYFDMS